MKGLWQISFGQIPILNVMNSRFPREALAIHSEHRLSRNFSRSTICHTFYERISYVKKDTRYSMMIDLVRSGVPPTIAIGAVIWRACSRSAILARDISMSSQQRRRTTNTEGIHSRPRVGKRQLMVVHYPSTFCKYFQTYIALHSPYSGMAVLITIEEPLHSVWLLKLPSRFVKYCHDFVHGLFATTNSVPFYIPKLHFLVRFVLPRLYAKVPNPFTNPWQCRKTIRIPSACVYHHRQKWKPLCSGHEPTYQTEHPPQQLNLCEPIPTM
jgi:hypothetical protein